MLAFLIWMYDLRRRRIFVLAVKSKFKSNRKCLLIFEESFTSPFQRDPIDALHPSQKLKVFQKTSQNYVKPENCQRFRIKKIHFNYKIHQN